MNSSVFRAGFLAAVGAFPLWPPMSMARANRVYRAVLRSPGGELPFFIERSGAPPAERAVILNGDERITVTKTTETDRGLTLEFPHYESVIEARFKADRSLAGTWKKRAAAGVETTMEFSARPDGRDRFERHHQITEEIVNRSPVAGRWSAKFADDADPAVGIFKQGDDRSVEGTFLTTTGDYRYLAGSLEHGLLRLSCFDGAHAFLLVAQMQSDGTLKGDFWSGPKYHDTWMAHRDDNAALPDAFSLTKVNPTARLKDLKFRGLDGKTRWLGEPGLLGKATVIEIFGSWCPNCHDAADLLVDLDKRYGPRGLKIVGLAFEATGDFDHDGRQVRTYLDRHHANYPVLLAGIRDTKKASAALPVVDRLRGYPTFLFVDRDGVVRSAYTGFSGPATGDEYAKLRRQFEAAIQRLLNE